MTQGSPVYFSQPHGRGEGTQLRVSLPGRDDPQEYTLQKKGRGWALIRHGWGASTARGMIHFNHETTAVWWLQVDLEEAMREVGRYFQGEQHGNNDMRNG